MKRVITITPLILMAACLIGCKNNNNPTPVDPKDPFVITSEEEFNAAIGMTVPGTDYLQFTYQSSTVYSYIFNFTYAELNVSPTVFQMFGRSTQSTKPDEGYVKKNATDYTKYSKDEKGDWKKDTGDYASEFKVPSDFSMQSTMQLGNVTYKLIKNKYDKQRLGYFFNTTNQGGFPYTCSLSFYEKRLTSMSYSFYDDETGYCESYFATFMYGEITPELPDVPDIP